jgi:hypothetical protein
VVELSIPFSETNKMKSLSSVTLLVAGACGSLGAASAFVPTHSGTRVATHLGAEDDKKKSVSDGLWGAPPKKDGSGDKMSKALPFVQSPKILDGSLPGDAGFDPFSFAQDKETLWYMREAEIKHSRLAMLAVVGWPLAELFDKPIAQLIGKPELLTKSGESPSLLNGGLEKIDIEYWLLVLGIAGLVEVSNADQKTAQAKNYIPGDCGFDPLNLFPKEKKERFDMQTKEIKHGRITMMAIVGFAIQEALYGVPVTAETPFFFQPLF